MQRCSHLGRVSLSEWSRIWEVYVRRSSILAVIVLRCTSRLLNSFRIQSAQFKNSVGDEHVFEFDEFSESNVGRSHHPLSCSLHHFGRTNSKHRTFTHLRIRNRVRTRVEPYVYDSLMSSRNRCVLVKIGQSITWKPFDHVRMGMHYNRYGWRLDLRQWCCSERYSDSSRTRAGIWLRWWHRVSNLRESCYVTLVGEYGKWRIWMSRGSVMGIRIVASSHPIKFDGVEWRRSSDSGSSCRIKAYLHGLWRNGCEFSVWYFDLYVVFYIGITHSFILTPSHTHYADTDHQSWEGSVRKKDIFLPEWCFWNQCKEFEKFMDRYNSHPKDMGRFGRCT